VFFVLAGRGGGCVIPQSAPEAGLLLERLQRMPGFDSAAVIRAMGSVVDAKFVCWRRAARGEDAATEGPRAWGTHLVVGGAFVPTPPTRRTTAAESPPLA
jgi:hypothetical protein